MNEQAPLSEDPAQTSPPETVDEFHEAGVMARGIVDPQNPYREQEARAAAIVDSRGEDLGYEQTGVKTVAGETREPGLKPVHKFEKPMPGRSNWQDKDKKSYAGASEATKDTARRGIAKARQELENSGQSQVL